MWASELWVENVSYRSGCHLSDDLAPLAEGKIGWKEGDWQFVI
jgi:hypothetical protein